MIRFRNYQQKNSLPVYWRIYTWLPLVLKKIFSKYFASGWGQIWNDEM